MADASGKSVDQLVADLGSKDAGKRLAARAALVQIGSAAVPALLGALDAHDQHVRWAAGKSLTAIADPSAACKLVDALDDKDTDVRWVAGEALIALGRDAVEPLLARLTQSDPPGGMYQGAHHVLHDLVRERPDLAPLLMPVYQALDHPEPEVAVPVAAQEALRTGGW
jgi:HEAT repeat protein